MGSANEGRPTEFPLDIYAFARSPVFLYYLDYMFGFSASFPERFLVARFPLKVFPWRLDPVFFRDFGFGISNQSALPLLPLLFLNAFPSYILHLLAPYASEG